MRPHGRLRGRDDDTPDPLPKQQVEGARSGSGRSPGVSAGGGRVDGVLRGLDDDEAGTVEGQLHGLTGTATE